MLRKKRCRFCRKLFRPDPRVGDRQYACGARGCQAERRVQNQASWRSRNPSYPVSYRLKKRSAQAAEVASERAGSRAVACRIEPPSNRPWPVALKTFPWDLAEETFGWLGADLLALLALRLACRDVWVKVQREAERPLSMGIYAPAGRDP